MPYSFRMYSLLTHIYQMTRHLSNLVAISATSPPPFPTWKRLQRPHTVRYTLSTLHILYTNKYLPDDVPFV
jgi:hypothetical protein